MSGTNMEQKVKKREWVKTAAIIFLVILLVLTFFSNTIMNRSLPEVAAQAVTSGSINARIRGSGTVSANETYDVTISQSRKVQSVLVRVGDQVSTGDVLFVLDPQESAELKAAQETLKSMERSYQEQLTSATNEAAREDRQIQKAREAYNEALALYRQYTDVEPSQLKSKLSAAQTELKALNKALDEAREALSDAKADPNYTNLSADISKMEGQVSQYEGEIEALSEQLNALYKSVSDNTGDRTEADVRKDLAAVAAEKSAAQTALETAKGKLSGAQSALAAAQTKLATSEVAHGADYRELMGYAQGQDHADAATVAYRMQAYAANAELLRDAMIRAGRDDTYITDEKLAALKLAYETITADEAALANAQKALNALQTEIAAYEAAIADCDGRTDALNKELQIVVDKQNNAAASRNEQIYKLQNEIGTAQYALSEASRVLTALKNQQANWQMHFAQLEALVEQAEDKVEAQQDLIDDYSEALSAASQVEAAQQTLEELTFNASLDDLTEMNLQAARDKIEEQKLLIEELSTGSDAVEVKAKVSGTISAVHCSAGNTVSSETPMATITITDRGYTMKISVTNEQAQKVRVGDVANVTNYYFGDITATLEKIANDPQNQGRGKLLIFRISGSDVEPGTNLTLSIGQKSASYDTLIPNSAIRTDSNGSFVLVLVAKSTPLRTRYVATRAEINILAQDDTTAAVSGLANGDFVITTSSHPLEAGDQVRLVDE
ncbi:MAG: HlyD family efflux transporter periplasmic adaptor subunit [Ruminococcaceae bacterium]|nr:HlyD family efflux transporter periplasmic adaptor subunit [Oscillospiraceae bacterium]